MADSEYQLRMNHYKTKKYLWLTSGWDFTPYKWGCVGFTDEWARKNFAVPERIAAVYVVKSKGPKEKRGMVVGFVELSKEEKAVSKFVCPKFWKEHEAKFQKMNKNKNRTVSWHLGVGVKRAWLVVRDDWKKVDVIFKDTYKNNAPRFIGRCGVVVKEKDFSKLKELRIKATRVYTQGSPNAEPEIKTVGDLLRVRKIEFCDLD